jgi:hypothetical protein
LVSVGIGFPETSRGSQSLLLFGLNLALLFIGNKGLEEALHMQMSPADRGK